MRVGAMVIMLVYHVVLLNMRPGLFTTVLRGIGRAGWIGTEVFFVIAGYYCFQLATQQQPVHSRSFTIFGRAVRLLPPYLLFLAFYLTAGVAVQRAVGNDFSLSIGYVLYFPTFTTNLALATGPRTGVALEGLFAIAIGVQLYLLLTLVFRVVSSFARRVTILLGLLSIAVVLRALLHEHTPWFLYFFTLTRLDGFVIGALLGVLASVPRGAEYLKRNRLLLLVTGAVILVATAAVTEGLNLWLPRSHQFTYPLVSLAFASLLNYALHTDPSPLVRKLGNLGKYSYSVYLFKLPARQQDEQAADIDTSENYQLYGSLQKDVLAASKAGAVKRIVIRQ